MEKPFNKILVANRGEIAVRVIRAAKELGISTVAVYSSADRDSLHVKLADEAYEIGPPEPLRSYLDMDKIIDVALKTGAEAIHPGYGFLAENAKFVELVEKSGLVFVGPTAETMRLMGDKVMAKRVAHQAGVPVIPGRLKHIESAEEALDLAEELGYPVLLKPAGGGGGIGMVVCRSPEELRNAFETSQRLALSAFGDVRLYVEKYLDRPRHIEVQILADVHGNVVHLGERECSIQRRNQKLIEESPSPAVNEELRERIGEAAKRVAKAGRYRNAGTVEFLYKDGEFYFMEVNRRIQVEHPVTELVTGIDIVKQQFYLAAGYELQLEQEDVKLRGHAIECRINAEDPINNFAPSPGRVLKYREPGGMGVRVDTALYEGYAVPGYYDPLIAKVITWGSTRSEAISRMVRALSEYTIVGDTLRTNIGFHWYVIHDEEFISGGYDTTYVARKLDSIVEYLSEVNSLHVSLAAYTLHVKSYRRVEAPRPRSEAMPEGVWWRYSGLASLIKPWVKRGT